MKFFKILSIFSPESVESFFDSFKFQQDSSFTYLENEYLNIEMRHDDRKQIILNLKSQPIDLRLYSSKNHTQRPDISDKKLKKYLTNNIVNFHINLIEIAKKEIKLESSSNIENDQATEAKGLEWLRVTIVVLKKGIQHCLESDDLVYQQMVFSKKSESGFEIRMSTLSLDFKICFLKDSRLEVTCWNFKDSTRKSGDHAPVFKGYFYHQKNQVFDLFIPLIKQMSLASTVLKEL